MKRKKIWINLLCVSLVLGNITSAFAAVTESESNNYQNAAEETKETEVLYTKSASYFVTIPKTISLGSDKISKYFVKVDGDIPSDKEVYVSPIDSIAGTDDFDFYMKDQNTKNPKRDVVATVTQSKFYWNFQDAADGYAETNNQIEAEGLTAGTWKGTFDFEINMHNIASDKLVLTTDGDVAMATNSTYQTNAYINGENVNDIVEWISDNDNIMVTNGMLETKASANVGDTAKITVLAENSPSIYALEDEVENEVLSANFNVVVVDIAFTEEGTGESISSLEMNPDESKSIKASIVPDTVEGTVKWSTTATSGLNLVVTGNSVVIKVAADMPTGSTYDIIATYGTYSKILKVNIGSDNTEDSAVPTIEGVEDGGTYEPGQIITIKDDEMLNVNGKEIETTNNTYTFNEEGEYTISVSNKTGNEVAITITIQHTHDYVNNICTKCGERDPESINYVILRSDSGDKGTGFLGSSEIIRDEDDVKFIYFTTSSTGHYLSDDNCWDVSAAQDGSILAWYTYESLNHYYTVYIAPQKEGDVIRFPENSSGLFAYLADGNPNYCNISGWSNIDFSKVKNCSKMFYNTDLTYITFDADTSSVENMSYMFAYGANNGTVYDSLKLTFSNKVKTPNLKNADYMFYGTYVDSINNFEAISVIGDHMFNNYSKASISGFSENLKSIGTFAFPFYEGSSKLVIPDSVETIGENAFYKVPLVTLPCKFEGSTFGAESVELSHNYTTEILKEATCEEAGEKKYTCNNCGYSYIEEIGVLPHSYTTEILKEVTCEEAGEKKYTCNECGYFYIEEIEAGHFWQDNICTRCGLEDVYLAPESAYEDWTYSLLKSSNTIKLSRYKGSDSDVVVYANYIIDGVVYKTELSLSYGVSPFSSNKSIEKITFSRFIDTSNMTNMKNMFYGCSGLKSIEGLNYFITNNVTDMSYMFYNCSSLTSLDLSSFDTSKATSLKWMFYNCKALESIYVTENKWVTNQADTSYMYSSCNVSSVTYK